ncbi:MAG: glycosyltransferase family 39 protein [Candidatus Levyibacteriota bacterium]|nr:MAG: glycosyltransferase family 39 protein [Candidatus Levybacteria bacterium]
MRKLNLALLLLFLLTALLRFYRLGDIPVGFHRDEAFLGYNAFSLLKTGRDMTGNVLPLHLESFLYSPAGYSYFSIPFIALFDLSAFSVRFASALFGSLTVIAFFFLVRITLENTKSKIPLIAVSFLAISPWHVNLSRTATENTLVLFFIIVGVLLFYLWKKRERSAFLFFSFASFGLTMFLYQASRAFLPLFVPFLVWVLISKTQLKKNIISIAFLYIFFILFPTIIILLSYNLSLRMRTVSIFAGEQTQLVLDEQIRGDGVSSASLVLTKLFHNKAVGYSEQFLENYFNHFTYNYLFADYGLPGRYKVPLVGLLYIFQLPFLMIGLTLTMIEKKRIGMFFIGWLVLVPIGSAFTFDDVPNLQRTLLMVPCFSFFSSAGLVWFYSFLKRHKRQTLFCVIFGIFVVWNVTYYLHQYYVHFNSYRPWYRQQGYAQLVSKVDILLPKYKKIVITNHESAPTIFFLFYKKYDPVMFQKQIENKALDNYDRINFDKYTFSQEECPLRQAPDKKIIGEKGVLYVDGSGCKLPTGAYLVDTVYRLDNSVAFQIMSLN